MAQRHYKDPYKERGRWEKQSQRRRCEDGHKIAVIDAESLGPRNASSSQELGQWRLVPWGGSAGIMSPYRVMT